MGNPLFNKNRMKLGVMAFNCSHGSTVTTAENSWRMTWEENKQLAQLSRRLRDGGFASGRQMERLRRGNQL